MNIDVVLILIFVQVIMGERTDKVLALQFSALRELQVILHYYEQRGYSSGAHRRNCGEKRTDDNHNHDKSRNGEGSASASSVLQRFSVCGG